MPKPEITTQKVKCLVKVPWRLRLKWRWMNRKLRKLQRESDFIKYLQEEEHYLLLHGVCPASGDACRGNCTQRCAQGLGLP